MSDSGGTMSIPASHASLRKLSKVHHNWELPTASAGARLLGMKPQPKSSLSLPSPASSPLAQILKVFPNKFCVLPSTSKGASYGTQSVPISAQGVETIEKGQKDAYGEEAICKWPREEAGRAEGMQPWVRQGLHIWATTTVSCWGRGKVLRHNPPFPKPVLWLFSGLRITWCTQKINIFCLRLFTTQMVILCLIFWIKIFFIP